MGFETPVVCTLNHGYLLYMLTNVKVSYLKITAARVKFKEIGGSLHKWWNMWFNSIIREKPYRCSTLALENY